MKRVLLSILTTALIFSLGVSCCGADTIMRMSDRRIVDFSRMLADIRGTRLIFIGEDHERMEDHLHQLKIIRALQKAGAPLAIGLEMFTADSQGSLDRWVDGKVSEEEFIGIYRRNWDMPWPLYRDIFLFARRYAIPMLGLNVRREITRKVAHEGFAALSPEERKTIPAGVTCNVDSAYMTFIRKAFAEHAMGDKLFIHFCEAQMLWNKSMATRLQEYIRRHPGSSVVVLAGIGHAMKPAIPREVHDDAGIDARVILPINNLQDSATVTEDDTDYLIER